ncbi:MAG: hypothetical protein IPJ94_22680, partial [Chloroflexi bacterium]|nr:hypothetical protein [Chloroflexota bacterium]
LRRIVEEENIGLRLNTEQVKPVHLANGLFRTLLGKTNDTSLLKRFVVTHSRNGTPPKGHDSETLYSILSENRHLDATELTQDDLTKLRGAVRKIVVADRAVFAGDSGESYSAGGELFLTRDRFGQEGGEFIAQWLQAINSPLTAHLSDQLRDRRDIINVLGSPLLINSNQADNEPALLLYSDFFNRFDDGNYSLNKSMYLQALKSW